MHSLCGICSPASAITERPGVYDRLAALAPPPNGVTREGILRLDRTMLDAWWSSFGFGDIHLWRTYERRLVATVG